MSIQPQVPYQPESKSPASTTHVEPATAIAAEHLAQVPTQRPPPVALPPRAAPSESGSPGGRRPPVDPPGKSTDSAGAVMALLGGGLIALGSFLPWEVLSSPLVGTIGKNGMDNGGDGTITIVLGVVIIALGAARFGLRTNAALLAAPIVLSIFAIVIAIGDVVQVQGRIANISSPYVLVSVGGGLYTIILGAVLACVGSLIFIRRAPTTSSVAPPAAAEVGRKFRVALVVPLAVLGVSLLTLGFIGLRSGAPRVALSCALAAGLLLTIGPAALELRRAARARISARR